MQNVLNGVSMAVGVMEKALYSSYTPTGNLFAWYVGGIALGAFFAFVVVAVFRKLVSPGSTREYWTALSVDIRGLLFGDEDQYWQYYGNVIRRSAKYVVRQLLAVILALAPLAIAVFVLGPWMFARWDEGATLVVIPADAGTLTGIPESTNPGERAQILLTLSNGYQVPLLPLPGSQVLCPPRSIGCLVLLGFGFSAHTVDQELTGSTELVVVRTAHADWNPVWPYLSDPEFLFFASLSLFSLIFFMRRSDPNEADSSGYEIGLVDYFLIQLAFRNSNLMNRLGDWESARFSRRLADIVVTKPVFIAGLARSGTTILLQKLSSVSGVATHQYRDFPFVMTPVFWNRFLKVFAARQKPIERPHKDKIMISRDSPDAFEEPLWQHFFPYLHDVSSLHRLDASVENDEFAKFYREHIQKILLIRSGSRYVSKGNYNLPRIEFIGSIFPNARFLIPVRHPLAHVDSLVRQHQLFSAYAKQDPKVPDYLRAAGHYEFGPQRAPICLTAEGSEKILAAWEEGDDHLGYALQWAEVYEFVAELCAENEQLQRRIRIIRFEDLCRRPEDELKRILDFVEIGDDASPRRLAQGIVPSVHDRSVSSDADRACWQVVEHVAARYGYSRSSDELQPVSEVFYR